MPCVFPPYIRSFYASTWRWRPSLAGDLSDRQHSAIGRPARATALGPVAYRIAGRSRAAGTLDVVPSLPPISGNGVMPCANQEVDNACDARIGPNFAVMFDDA